MIPETDQNNTAKLIRDLITHAIGTGELIATKIVLDEDGEPQPTESYFCGPCDGWLVHVHPGDHCRGSELQDILSKAGDFYYIKYEYPR